MFNISEGNFLERILSNLFPPRLPSRMNPVDDLKNTIQYQYRLSRTGFEAHPLMSYGGRIVPGSLTEYVRKPRTRVALFAPYGRKVECESYGRMIASR